MHGQSGGLACRQRRIQAFVQAFEEALGDGQLLPMQIGHLRAKRVLDALPSAHPLDGPVDVVRRRDHGQRRKAGAEARTAAPNSSVTSVSRPGGISASTCATVAAFPTGTKRLTTLSASTGSPGGRGSPDRVRSAPSPARVRLGRARRRC